MTMNVTATHTVTYALPAPSCSTTTTVTTEYSSVTPKMSVTGDTNSSLVILGAFIAVLAALLVAVTTGWIVTCVVNRRKDKASTTRYNSNTV